jgi:quinol monooxygenase YgiN
VLRCAFAHRRIKRDRQMMGFSFNRNLPMTMPLNVIAILKARAGREQDLSAFLQSALPGFQAEPGCIAYALMTDHDNPARIVSYETWVDEAALNVHLHSPAMVAAGPKLADMLAAPMELIKLTAFPGSTV